MNRVGCEATLSLRGWCRGATVATGDKTGKEWTATEGAPLCDEMQTEQPLVLPVAMACV